MADNLSNKIKGLYITGTKIKDLVLNGVSLFNNAGTPPTGSLVIDGHTVTKLMVFGVCAYDGSISQGWSDDAVPTVTGLKNLSKIPLDALATDGGFIAVSQRRAFSIIHANDSLQSNGGFIGTASVTRKFEFISGSDSIQSNGGFVGATLTTVEL